MSSEEFSYASSSEVSRRSWIAVVGAILGAFMAVLDIQITNASLKDITGGIGATLDEGSWVSTSYLVAEIIVIPLSGWLSKVFSTRTYLVTTSILFLFFSVCCGLAWNLSSMIVFRALQGFTGGALIPMAFQIILTELPPAKRAIGLALFSFTATFAPTIGPIIGGWLTETYSWQMIFYINLLPGVVMLATTWYAIKPEKKRLDLIKGADWSGIITMAIGLSSLTIFLEEGNRKDWFGDHVIATLFVLAIIFLSLFFVIELRKPEPFIRLRLFARRNFGIGSLVNFTMGVGLYGSVYLLPLYLGEIQGYNALQIGLTIMWSGLPQLIIFPAVPYLMKRIDLRWLVAFGVTLFAASCFMNSHMSPDTAIDQLMWSQLVRAMGQPLIMVPLSAIATGEIGREEAGSASGLFNMLRNLGGSVGIAMLSTLLTRREQFHSNRIGESISLYVLPTQIRLKTFVDALISQGYDPVTANDKAIAGLDYIVRQQATLMAFNDCFFLMGIALLCAGVFIVFSRKVTGGGAEGAH